MPGGITLFSLLVEEGSLCRQPEVADSSNAAMESQDGKTSIADSVPSTDQESDEEDSVQSNQEEGVEFPFVHMGGVVEDVKEVPVKEESKRGEKKTGLGNRWRVMKKSMKGSRLFPKRVKKKDNMKPKNNTEPKQDTHGPKPPPIIEAFETPSTSNVVPAPPERASFWDQVKGASRDTMAAMDPVNKSSMIRLNFVGSVESEAQYRKKNEGGALSKRWPNVMAENEEADACEVDELISTILTDFGDEGVEQELEEKSAGCVYIALPSTAEMTLVSCVDKVDFMNSCGCRIDTVHENGDLVLDKEAIASEANDDTIITLKSDCSVHSGKGTGSEEDVSSESTKMDLPQDDTESEDSIITAPSVEEITMSTCTFDDESLASEYDDFKKAMVLLRNRAARQGLTEQHLLQKIRTEQEKGVVGGC